MQRQRRLLFGGDYNPDQWPAETLQEDVRLFKAAGINSATVGIFAWSKLEPRPGRYEWGWLDDVIEHLHAHGISVILATPTAAPPVWLYQLYPDVLPVDENGLRYGYGSRRHYCPNHPAYRHHARQITTELAKRYGRHPAVTHWHVDNEYGCHISACYCPRCVAAFRQWLQQRYQTLEELNKAWYTAFWSQTYGAWEEIDAPRRTTTYHNPGHVLDWRRFMSDSYLACFLEQKEIIRAFSPGVPVTTNFMAWFDGLDYHAWAPHLDVVSWDSYPPTGADPAETAARHDLMRGLKGGRAPFLLMEQSPSQVNWMEYNRPQRPGEMRLRSWQAVAHGADAICFFQLRQSQGGAEKFHAAVIGHDGGSETRVFREVARLGAELARVGERITGSEVRAEVAILFSWPSWWAVEQPPRISKGLRYVDEVMRYYRALWQQHIEVDVVSPDADLSRYRLVVVPLLRIVTPELAQRLQRYVEDGGGLLVTYHSGLTDVHDRAHLGGYPGPLRRLCGVWVEEFDVLPPGQTVRVRTSESLVPWDGVYEAEFWCDVMHLEGARTLATYEDEYYRGMPAVTEHRVGRGRVVYVGTALQPKGTRDLIGWLTRSLGIAPVLDAPDGVEVLRRWPVVEGDGDRSSGQGPILFILNHRTTPVTLSLDGTYVDLLSGETCSGSVELSSRDVRVLIASPSELQS
ncbi:MAG TPA: beta-galactosidase [Limnochordales bacterium]